MSPIVVVSQPQVQVDAARRDVALGRLRAATLLEELDEPVGGSLETIGAAVVPGEPQARKFTASIPLRGVLGDIDRFQAGARARRQARSLLSNGPLLAAGLYFRFAVDPELNGWIAAAGGEIKPAKGGVTFADYTLDIGDAYRLGSLRSHRPARYVTVDDRRRADVPRDYLGRHFSTDFATAQAVPQVVLPAGVSDVLDGRGQQVLADEFPGADGWLTTVSEVSDGQILHFEQPESAQGLMDVVILDRRGFRSPTFTMAGDLRPQDAYGWEEVYGPDHAFLETDVPVVQNGLCRIRWISASAALALDAWDAAAGYVERCRLSLRRNFVSNGAAVGQLDELRSARVVAWTPEQAVIGLAVAESEGPARGDIYVTLQRGWSGPRIEMYLDSQSPALGSIRVTAPGTDWSITPRDNAAEAAIADGVDYGTWQGATGPIAVLTPPQGPGVALAVLHRGARLRGRADSWAYGAPRDAVDVDFQATLPAGYAGVFLDLGPRTIQQAGVLGYRRLHDVRVVPELVAR